MRKGLGLCSILRRQWGVLLVAPLFLTGVGGKPSALDHPRNQGDGYQIVALVNQVRSSYGLPALQANSALMAAAQAHSEYQASIGTVTHSGKGGSTPLQRAVAAGYGGGAKVYVSENIYGGNNASPSQAVNWWMGDGIHLQTMINPNATDAGAGIAQNGDTVFYTLLVGYVAGSPGGNSISPPVGGATKAPTAIPVVPIVTSTPNPDGSVVHVVQPGQALWNIAAVYKVPLADLLSLNGLTENSLIYPGDKILIRKAEATPTPEPTASPTPTATLMTPPDRPTLTSSVPIEVLRSPTALPALPDQKPEALFTQLPPSSASSKRIDFFPLLIIGLFVLGSALILMGSLIPARK
ncbi:MAG: CAP domain-containing protein [Anaerolineales bacterium]|nr:CAP domain-containing protein [Anaerolineales bacterium]MCS7248069.1 CAP domain-containing protein [Anaerolineales bacterium]MDW8161881.1 CAP domain-containing protein [Anaerolineales bacterium]MDW8447256.1 CAP domain-containing protein [Anaerolineales bacterium]